MSSLFVEVVVLQGLDPGPVVLLVQAKPGVGVWVEEGERGTGTIPVPVSFPNLRGLGMRRHANWPGALPSDAVAYS